MKPLHSDVTYISRCRCCRSKYTRGNLFVRKNSHKNGNSASRLKSKRMIQNELKED